MSDAVSDASAAALSDTFTDALDPLAAACEFASAPPFAFFEVGSCCAAPLPRLAGGRPNGSHTRTRCVASSAAAVFENEGGIRTTSADQKSRNTHFVAN